MPRTSCTSWRTMAGSGSSCPERRGEGRRIANAGRTVMTPITTKGNNTKSGLFAPRNALPMASRTPVVELLNQRLADAIDLQGQCKQAHWNVKGPSFIALHKLFDDVYAEVSEYVDTIAERIVQLGGV